MDDRYTLYSMEASGNCYKARLLLHLLGLPFRLIETDPRQGATRTPEFLALNPNGRTPLLVLPDGRTLSESNAILLHLAEGTACLPADAYDRAVCYQWLFFEQYEHEPTIAVARSWLTIYPRQDRQGDRRTARRLERARQPRPRRDGDSASPTHDWFAGDSLLGRRHRALRLHPCRRRRRLRPRAPIPASADGSIASPPSPATSA